MADTYWGASPEILTVSASPPPTTTGFTVSNATNLLPTTVDHPGQYILVKVAGVHQRAQIQSIVGNAITLTAPLSGVPDTPGEVVNSRELIAKDKLNSQAVFHAADATDLKTVNTTRAKDNLKYYIPNVGMYRFSSSSTATGDDYRVITPTAGPGRFLLDLPSNLNPIITQNSHGFVLGTPVRQNGSTWVAAQGTSMSGCQGVWIVTERTTNTFRVAQIGRVTIAATTAGALSTALVAGDLLYLSKTAGAVTTVKPIGDNSAPLGFHLPLFVVESVSGGQAVIHILGQGYPTIDEILADYYLVSGTTNTVTFSNLDIASHGERYLFSGEMFCSGAESVLFRPNGNSGSSYNTRTTTEPDIPGGSSTNVTNSLATGQVGTQFCVSTASSQPNAFEIDLRRYGSASFSGYLMEFSTWEAGGAHTIRRRSGVSQYPSTTGNITSCVFQNTGSGLTAGTRIRLLRGSK